MSFSEACVLLMNLIFIPMTAIVGCIRRKLWDSEKFGAVVRVMAVIGQIFVLTMLVAKLTEFFFGVTIVYYGRTYTVLALIVSCVYPIAAEYMRKFFSVEVRRKEDTDGKEE